jgi:hypothetical protein
MTDTTKMSHLAAELLNNLRQNVEGVHDIEPDGRIWFTVYLDNATADVPARSLPGLLSALSKAGLYEPQDGFAFGSVLGTAAMAEEMAEEIASERRRIARRAVERAART